MHKQRQLNDQLLCLTNTATQILFLLLMDDHIFNLQGSSTSSFLQSKTDSSTWKATIAYNPDVEETQETQVVEETAFPITLGDDWKASETLDVNQAMQMHVEETLLYEDEAATVTKVDKPQSQKDKIVRESSSSVINFSPQSASTQVFCSDAETSFLPTLVLETSDHVDADDNLVPPPFPTTAISLPSENLVSFLPNIKTIFLFYAFKAYFKGC